MMRAGLLAIAAVLLIAAAPDPADRLADPVQEARARALFVGVRCVVCQNETIDDSEAELAHDLRQTVRAQVAFGRSDEQIKAFLVQRYGDFILLKPRLNPATALLWAGPFAIVFIGLGWIALRRRTRASPDLLTPEELNALNELDNPPQAPGPP